MFEIQKTIRLSRRLKSDMTFLGRHRRWLHHLGEHIGDGLELSIVQLHRLRQLLKLCDQFSRRGQQSTHPHEGSNDRNVGLDRRR